MKKYMIAIVLLSFSTLLAGCEDFSQSVETPEESIYNEKTTAPETETIISKSGVKVKLGSSSKTRPIYIERKEYEEENIINADVGDIVIFGDRDITSGYSPSKWHVIKKTGNIYTLFSTEVWNIGESNPFSYGSQESDWESCNLRMVLNSKFYHDYFTDEEREMIVETKVKNDIGNDTLDYVYIPSVEETLELEEDIRYPMPERGGYAQSGWGCHYWTRTHDIDDPSMLFTVNYNEIEYGGYNERSCYMDNYCPAFRPIINIRVQ